MPPRRYRPRKARRAPKRRARRAGRAIDNTKTQVRAVYKQDSAFVVANSNSATVGFYGFTTYSPFNATTVNVTQSAEFQAQRVLYDEFCITKVKVNYTPVVTTTAPANVFTNLATSYMMYTVVDRDGRLPVSTSTNVGQKLESYDSFKKFLLTKNITRTIKCKPMWIDANNAAIDPTADSAYQPYVNAGLTQLIAFWCQNVPFAAGVQLGTIRIEWHVAFRGKKAMSYSLLPDGVSLVMTPVEAFLSDIIPLNPPQTNAEVLQENIVECVDGVIQVRSLRDNSIVPVPE